MKITIVQGAFLPVPPLRGGAIEKTWLALGREFVRRGHEVVHLSRQFPGLPNAETIDGVTHRRFRGHDAPRSLAKLKLLDFFYSCRVALQLPPADILVTHTFWLPMLVRSPRPGKLYVHVARYPRGQMRLYSHASRLQTVSRPIQDAIVAEAPRLASRVCSIPYPVIRRDEATAPGATERKKEILYVGRIHPEKGLHLLIDAFVRLPASDWRLVIVGPSAASAGGGGEDYAAELRQRAGPAQDRIDWIGPVFDAAKLDGYYARASLFVYPSLAEKGETFGVAPLEAMACGCPVLLSDLACFREFLVEDVNGFRFDHRSNDQAGSLATTLDLLLRSPDRLAAAGRHALDKAAEFSLERIASLYLDDFQSLLTERSAS